MPDNLTRDKDAYIAQSHTNTQLGTELSLILKNSAICKRGARCLRDLKEITEKRMLRNRTCSLDND